MSTAPHPTGGRSARRHLTDGWRDREALHQLHPLLVHAILFGGPYAASAVAAARRDG